MAKHIKVDIDTAKYTGQTEWSHISDELENLSIQIKTRLDELHENSGHMPGERNARSAVKTIHAAAMSLRVFDESGY